MDHQVAPPLPPHVLVFPLPIQGHVNSMLKLAELLCLGKLHVTMLVSEYSHSRFLRHTHVHSHFARYPGFSFRTIPDGLPDDHPRAGERFMEIFPSLKSVTGPLFREMMIGTNFLGTGTRRPVTCIIADGILGFAGDLAIEREIPLIYFRTISACSFWAYFCLPQLIEADEIPLKGINGMDLPVKSVPGMEGFLRRRDLPSFCRVDEVNDLQLELFNAETRQSRRAQALIKNTFDDLEGPILSQIRTHCPNLFPIGPLHAHLKARLAADTNSSSTYSSSFWEEDRSCVTWLDSQPSKSVIYVSFGSLTIVTKHQLMEFWYGLVNSGQRFLWVMRPDSIAEKDEGQIPVELVEGTRERGYMVEWAPQEEVLAHAAVGGFLTHSGWNSTSESIVSGVPMICWPYFADQTINSRFVGEVWKLGLDMKDTCDRVVIEKMIRDLMDVKKDEFQERANHMAKLAKQAVSENGSSYCNLDNLIKYIKSMIE
ncbi:7-deoxyloganetic acid glucosyl transferase-like [Cornus florida]|uniref:7-deoxyloganetic acid glucosyl transferase-like n=1 Tax=Cornus florida TaxID=4283 RepID=UPI0028A0E75B|nr:7-deoxyloganetic acid glucosyl transferase-like [Cornus florida]